MKSLTTTVKVRISIAYFAIFFFRLSWISALNSMAYRCILYISSFLPFFLYDFVAQWIADLPFKLETQVRILLLTSILWKNCKFKYSAISRNFWLLNQQTFAILFKADIQYRRKKNIAKYAILIRTFTVYCILNNGCFQWLWSFLSSSTKTTGNLFLGTA